MLTRGCVGSSEYWLIEICKYGLLLRRWLAESFPQINRLEMHYCDRFSQDFIRQFSGSGCTLLLLSWNTSTSTSSGSLELQLNDRRFLSRLRSRWQKFVGSMVVVLNWWCNWRKGTCSSFEGFEDERLYFELTFRANVYSVGFVNDHRVQFFE